MRRSPAVAEQIIVFDTTLRDGEQAPGINLNAKAKVESGINMPANIRAVMAPITPVVIVVVVAKLATAVSSAAIAIVAPIAAIGDL